MYLYDENCITPNFPDQGGTSAYYYPNVLKQKQIGFRICKTKRYFRLNY